MGTAHHRISGPQDRSRKAAQWRSFSFLTRDTWRWAGGRLPKRRGRPARVRGGEVRVAMLLGLTGVPAGVPRRRRGVSGCRTGAVSRPLDRDRCGNDADLSRRRPGSSRSPAATPPWRSASYRSCRRISRRSPWLPAAAPVAGKRSVGTGRSTAACGRRSLASRELSVGAAIDVAVPSALDLRPAIRYHNAL